MSQEINVDDMKQEAVDLTDMLASSLVEYFREDKEVNSSILIASLFAIAADVFIRINLPTHEAVGLFCRVMETAREKRNE